MEDIRRHRHFPAVAGGALFVVGGMFLSSVISSKDISISRALAGIFVSSVSCLAGYLLFAMELYRRRVYIEFNPTRADTPFPTEFVEGEIKMGTLCVVPLDDGYSPQRVYTNAENIPRDTKYLIPLWAGDDLKEGEYVAYNEYRIAIPLKFNPDAHPSKYGSLWRKHD